MTDTKTVKPKADDCNCKEIPTEDLPSILLTAAGGRVFESTNWDCQADAVQTLANNQIGDDVIATMTVVNNGACPVSIGTGKKRGDFSGGGGETLVPGLSREFVRVLVPAGTFLLASCVGNNKCGCNWRIIDLLI